MLSLYRAGALAQLTEVLKKYRIPLVALQEIRWKDSNILRTKEYTIFYSGGSTNNLGTGFAVKKEMAGNVIGFKPVSDRFCSLRLRRKFFNILFINVHTPTEDADDNTKEAFYDGLERIYDEAPKHDIKIVLEYFNAKIGKESAFIPIIGQESLHEETNNNGIRLVDFASGKGIFVYQQHKIPT
uniref:Endonuclease/exonuclease/phosphatase domain-containing protein n=1 Tax=Biomphalaria glabrata TaxID=6526 RepID=A0A2C9KQI7_BIOGL